MKALEILRKIKKKTCMVQTPFGDYYHISSVDNVVSEEIVELEELELKYDTQEIYIDDLRKELEALQAPKTCEGCMYYSVDDWNDFRCLHSQQCIRDNTIEDYYKPKDTQ